MRSPPDPPGGLGGEAGLGFGAFSTSIGRRFPQLEQFPQIGSNSWQSTNCTRSSPSVARLRQCFSSATPSPPMTEVGILLRRAGRGFFSHLYVACTLVFLPFLFPKSPEEGIPKKTCQRGMIMVPPDPPGCTTTSPNGASSHIYGLQLD